MHLPDSDVRAVSPVIGGVLLVAIVVVLASVVGAMALSMDEQLREPPTMASFDAEYHPDGDGNSGKPYFIVTHVGGDIGDGSNVFIVDGDGDRIAWKDIWMGTGTVESGSEAHVDGDGSDDALNCVHEGEVYRIVWNGGNGNSHVISEFRATSGPENPAGGCT